MKPVVFLTTTRDQSPNTASKPTASCIKSGESPNRMRRTGKLLFL